MVKKYFALVLGFLFFLFSDASLIAAGRQEKPFSWNLALENVRTGDLIPFSAPVKSWNGERFRLAIESGTDFYCYVMAQSPAGDDVSVLRAGLLKAGESWFSPVLELTDPRGLESLIVIASCGEQKVLAQRIAAMTPGSVTSQRALMDEVFRLRGEVSQFQHVPEKPIFMGGAARGTPEKSMGVEFSGSQTYVKTISIEH